MTLVLEKIYRSTTDFDRFDPVLVRSFLAAQGIDTTQKQWTCRPTMFL